MAEALKAGRELDMLVAEKVFGMCAHRNTGKVQLWGTTCFAIGCTDCGQLDATTLLYSSDIRAAWQVVEHLQGKDYSIRLSNKAAAAFWWCYIYANTGTFAEATVQSGTAPEAICLAALKAVANDHD